MLKELWESDFAAREDWVSKDGTGMRQAASLRQLNFRFSQPILVRYNFECRKPRELSSTRISLKGDFSPKRPEKVFLVVARATSRFDTSNGAPSTVNSNSKLEPNP